MCGRYALTLPPEAVRRFFAYEEQPNFPPRYNIAPTQPVPVVRLWNGARQFVLMRWGFIPGWVKDPKDFPLVINVRRETAWSKPSFRHALGRRRCLMPADGFYEWRKFGTEKRPYLIRRPDRQPFAFAAIWETWNSPDGSEIDTAALITGPANGALAAIHDRCPVIVGLDGWSTWLDVNADTEAVDALMAPPPEDFFELVPIGKAVNRVANDGPELQEPVGEVMKPEPVRATPRRAKPGGGQGELF